MKNARIVAGVENHFRFAGCQQASAESLPKFELVVVGDQPLDSKRAFEFESVALRLAPNNGFVLFRAALVYEQAGMRDRALTKLEECLKAGYSIREIQKAPPLAELRKDERFQRLEAAQSAEHSISPGKPN